MERIGLGLNEILRYFYAGSLATLLFWGVSPGLSTNISKNLHWSVIVLIVEVAGIFVFTAYRVILGDLILYQINEKWISKCWAKYDGRENATIMQYVASLLKTNKRGKVRQAYRIVRSKIFRDEFRIYTNIRHGEIHVLYLSSIFALLFFILGYFKIEEKIVPAVAMLILQLVNIERFTAHVFASSFFLLMFVILLYGAFYADYCQHSVEGDYAKIKKAEVREILQSAGYF